MQIVYSDDHRLQHGRAELNDGQLMPVFEMPKRADTVLAAVKARNLGPVVAPASFDRRHLAAIHSEDFLSFLEGAWEAWVAEHGDAHDALPLTWPTRGFRQDRVPTNIDGRLSYYSSDAGTPITRGTWQAATIAANCALTAAKQVMDGAASSFSLSRPPGHHAGRDVYGGYCFLNNAAIAAQYGRDHGAAKVAILDVDYHHGNGTQSIFYDRGDVHFTSLHSDPIQEFPYFLGHADEKGVGAGLGCNANFPLPWGTDFAAYAAALDQACVGIAAYGADMLVVSLGVDTFSGDPISQFKLDSPDYLKIGAAIAGLKKPTVFVLEGGYAVDDIGTNVANVLDGFLQA